jgi:predicted  nucleic acid-binding Zn-ribbon protein
MLGNRFFLLSGVLAAIDRAYNRYISNGERLSSSTSMTQAQNPDDRDRQVERELRAWNRRVDRLEYTQVLPQEFRQAFDRVYEEEIDDLKDEIREMRSELNGKIDIIMGHITGQGTA